MKHNLKVTSVILLMFLLTQFIGLYVINQYSTEKVVDGKVISVNASKQIPYGMGMPEIEGEQDYQSSFISILFSFVVAIAILFLLMRFKAKYVLKIWFFAVIVIALGLTFTAFLPSVKYASLIGLALALPFAIGKIFLRDIVSHNVSELLIYPGIAAIFVPLLNITTMIIFLAIISLYDMWAVWKSGVMQKMAKYQMEEIKIFSGFYLPYASKKTKEKIKKLKKSKKDLSKSKLKINVAILGGGDVIFPMITAGVIMKTWGIWPAVGVIFGALLGLGFLLFKSEKKKFYPAMPFITAGIFLSLLVSWIVLRIF